MKKRSGHAAWRLVAVATVLGLLLTACGGDDSSSNNAGVTTSTTEEESTSTTEFTTETTETTDTTIGDGSPTTIAESGTTLPGGTPTTVRSGRTGTTIRRRGTPTTTRRTGGTTVTTVGSAPAGADLDAVVTIGVDLAAAGTLKFDPTTMGTGSYLHTLPVVRALLTRTTNLGFKPDLAESARVVNATTIEVNLRPNMKFSDGTDLDCQAVKATFFRNLASGNTAGLQIPDMQAVKAIDATTSTKCTIRLSRPHAGVVYALLAGVEFAPMSPKSFTDGTNLNTGAIGAGPMKIAEYVTNNRVEMVKNPYYWDAEHVYIKGITYRHVTPGAAVINGLRSGQIDWAQLDPDQAQNMQGDLKAFMFQTTGADTIQWCVKDGTPLGNLKVRQAVAHAINRDAYNGIIYNGASTEAWDLFPADSKFHDKSMDNLYRYDPAKAKQLLAEAGYPNGFKFTMAVPAVNQTRVEVLQAQLREVGITLDPNPSSPGNDYQLSLKYESSFSQSRPGPWDKVSRFYLSDSFSNACRYPVPQVDALYNKVAGMDLDDPAAVATWQQLSRAIFKDLAFFPQIVWRVEGYGYNAKRFGKLVTYVDQIGSRRVDPVGTYIEK